MKILYYFENKNTFMDQWQHFHIFDELKRHNCNITIISPLEYDSIQHANDELIKVVKNNNFDLFMTPYNQELLYISSLQLIKSIGIPTLLICFDNLLIPFYHKKIAKHFDLVWLTSKETKDLFIKWGASVIFMPYAANPFNFKIHDNQQINKIAFVGTPYGSRSNTINKLSDNNIEISLFTKLRDSSIDKTKNIPLIKHSKSAMDFLKFKDGRKVLMAAIFQKISRESKLNTLNGFINIYDPLSFEELSLVYSSYSLSLSSTTARNTGILRNPVNVVNLRSFEIPMSGGLQICSYFDEIAEYFEEDKEILFYRNDEELIDKSKFYIKEENYNIRLKMKKSARRRAELDHTWFNRFKKIFDYFALKYD